MDIKAKLSKIKLLAMDFDGVLTDGFVYIAENGKETVRCSRRDGKGIEMLKKNGIKLLVVSKEVNSVVEVRCRKLGIDCFYGLPDGKAKLESLKKYMMKNNISQNGVAFIGDDVQDLECLNYAAVKITVADGDGQCLKIAQYVTTKKGGNHAVREVCDMILETKK